MFPCFQVFDVTSWPTFKSGTAVSADVNHASTTGSALFFDAKTATLLTPSGFELDLFSALDLSYIFKVQSPMPPWDILFHCFMGDGR